MQKMANGSAVIVTEPVMRPHRCAVVPQMAQDPGGFVDTGVKLPGFEPRVYVSATGARELARAFGFPTPEQHQAAVDRVSELEQQIGELEEQHAGTQRRLGAYETLAADGVQITTRPPAKKTIRKTRAKES